MAHFGIYCQVKHVNGGLSRLFFLGLLRIVWMNFSDLIAESRFPQEFAEFPCVGKLGMKLVMRRARRLVDVYRFPAFRPRATVRGCSAIPRPASCNLSGGEKTVCGVCGTASRRIYDRKLRWVRDLSARDTRIYVEIDSRR